MSVTNGTEKKKPGRRIKPGTKRPRRVFKIRLSDEAIAGLHEAGRRAAEKLGYLRPLKPGEVARMALETRFAESGEAE